MSYKIKQAIKTRRDACCNNHHPARAPHNDEDKTQSIAQIPIRRKRETAPLFSARRLSLALIKGEIKNEKAFCSQWTFLIKKITLSHALEKTVGQKQTGKIHRRIGGNFLPPLS
jgi:hypothetical protein